MATKRPQTARTSIKPRTGKSSKGAPTVKGHKRRTAPLSGKNDATLRKELEATKRHLRLFKDNLRTSNEELQATNEELRTANDELAAAQEELKAGNEELQAINAELEDSLDALRRSEEHFRLLVQGVQDYAIFMLDPDGRITTWNEGGVRIKGYRAEEIIGKHFSRFYPPEAIKAGWPVHELECAVRDGRFEDEGWRVRKDGTQFWANVVITAIYGANGKHRGFAKITRDLTERKKIEESLRRSDERFRFLVEGVKEYAIFMLSPEGNVATWNAGAEQLKGYGADQIIGQHFSIFYPREAVEAGWPAHELERAAREGRFEDEGWRVRRDGSQFWANVVITAIYDSHGELTGFSKITRDLTERKLAMEQVRNIAAQMQSVREE